MKRRRWLNNTSRGPALTAKAANSIKEKSSNKPLFLNVLLLIYGINTHLLCWTLIRVIRNAETSVESNITFDFSLKTKNFYEINKIEFKKKNGTQTIVFGFVFGICNSFLFATISILFILCRVLDTIVIRLKKERFNKLFLPTFCNYLFYTPYS